MRRRLTTALIALAPALGAGCYDLPDSPPLFGAAGGGSGGAAGTEAGASTGGTTTGGTTVTGGATSTGGTTATGGTSATGGTTPTGGTTSTGGAGASTGGSGGSGGSAMTGGTGGQGGTGGRGGGAGTMTGGAGAGGTMGGRGGASAGGAGSGGKASGGAGSGGKGGSAGGGAIVELAQGRAATADSEENNTTSNPPKVNLATSGNDASATTRWCAANGGQHYWQVDLGASHVLSRVEIDFEYPTQAAGLPYGYVVAVSSDGTAFTDSINQSANTSSTTTQTANFPTSTSGRHVRITVIPPTTTPNATWASFWEARVFGQ